MLRFDPNTSRQAMANINKAKNSLNSAKGKRGSIPSDYSLAGDLNAIYSGIESDLRLLDEANSVIGANVQRNNQAEGANEKLIAEMMRRTNFVGHIASTARGVPIAQSRTGNSRLSWSIYNSTQQQIRDEYSDVIQRLYWTGKLSDTTSDREIINVLGISHPNSAYGSESDENKRISCGQGLFTSLRTDRFTCAMAYSMAGEAWQYAVRSHVDNGTPLPTAMVHVDDIVYQNSDSGFSPLSLGEVPGANTNSDPSKSDQTYLDTTSACVNGAIAAETDQLFIRSIQPDGASRVDERSENLLPVYDRLAEMDSEELAGCGITTREGVAVIDVEHSSETTFTSSRTGFVRTDNIYIITYENAETGEQYSVEHEICEVDSTHTNLNNGSQTRGDEPLYVTEMSLVWLKNKKDMYDEAHRIN